MFWDYRIVKKETKNNSGQIIDTHYFISEVYYDENNKACMCTTEPEGPCAETISEMFESWIMLAEAFNKPILNIDNIPEDGAVSDIDEAMQDLHDETGQMKSIEQLVSEGKLVVHNSEDFLKDVDLDKIYEERRQEAEEDEMRHNIDCVGENWVFIVSNIMEKYINKQKENDE